ncbi:MAG: MBL fold metallo-hydrolase [Planctomycetaceae bacterium]|jgi:Cft2 family RNA processing exonuclease|nr:MBL fold metallo-hydrolase [Planctomycetaceae bacterium]
MELLALVLIAVLTARCTGVNSLRGERVFFWDRGIRLAGANLAMDFQRPQACAFVSHAHADHFAKHQLALCTPETATLYLYRLATNRAGGRKLPKATPKVWTPEQIDDKHRVKKTPYLEPIDWGGLRLTAYPAGHCLGSAMLYVENPQLGKTLLYTGDFKLGASRTSREIVIPHADILIMESTFGLPQHRLPPRDAVIADLLQKVRQVLTRHETPVLYAYSLGKSQEVTRILLDDGLTIRQHPAIFEISRIYEHHGVALGIQSGETLPLIPEQPVENGCVVILPPFHSWKSQANQVRFAVTGWAIESGASYRFGVEESLPLSDHADYDDLIQMVRQVSPEITYCTHGPLAFVDELNSLGFPARPASRPWQQRLFF